MKKTIFVCFLLFAFYFLPPTVFAHVLKYDGSIGAVLHVDPDDDPVAGENTNFFFEFKDKTNKFNPADCDCKIIVNQNGNEIYSGDILAGNSSPTLANISFKYTFPTIGIYNVVVNGSPKSSEEFQKFSLTFDIRVARTNSNDAPASSDKSWWSYHQWHVVLPILIAITTMIVYILSNKKKEK